MRPPGSPASGRDAGYPPAAAARRTSGVRRRRYPWLIVAIVAALVAGGVSWWLAAGRYVSVPQLIGMARDAATKTVTDAHLSLALDPGVASETVAVGNVAEQTPRPGTSLTRGDQVHLRLSTGPQQFAVPDLAGMSFDDARTALEANQLAVGQTDNANDDTVPAGKLIRSDPPAGSNLQRGSPVNLTVSSGPAPVEVPTDLDEQPADSVEGQLRGLGLQVQRQTQPNSDVPAGEVITVSPTGTVTRGTTVTLVVSGGAEQVWLPDVKGQRMSDARSQLESAGFSVHARLVAGHRPVGARAVPGRGPDG